MSAPVPDLARTIQRYLRDTAERGRIVANAYDLVTTELALQNCVAQIMAAIPAARAAYQQRFNGKAA